MHSHRNTLWLDRRRSPKLRDFVGWNRFFLLMSAMILDEIQPTHWKSLDIFSPNSQCPGMRKKILRRTRINFGRGQMEFVFREFSLATGHGRAQTFFQSKSLPLETGRRKIYGLFTLPISMDWDVNGPLEIIGKVNNELITLSSWISWIIGW